NRTANFDFASTPSSVDEYPRVVREPISRHADLRPSSKPFRKALRFSSSPILCGIRPGRPYRDFVGFSHEAEEAMRGRQPAPNRLAGGLSAGPLTDVSEVFALVRSFGGRLDVLQLRRDLIDLFRLVLELVEGDLEPQVFREDVQDGLRALRIDEVTGRLPHQAHRLHVIQAAESEQQTARADNAGTGFPAGEHDTVLLHLLHEIRARR